MKIDSHIIFEIHRLFDLGYKQRKIARQLGTQPANCEKISEEPEPATNQTRRQTFQTRSVSRSYSSNARQGS